MVARSGQSALSKVQKPGQRERLLTRWTNKRLKITGDELTLDRHRLFILPTKAGLAFGTTLGVLLLFALNYNNSMIFAATFLLASVAINAIWQTHLNLLDLNVTLIAPPIHMAERPVHIDIRFRSGRVRLRPCIELNIPHTDQLSRQVTIEGEANVALTLPSLKRGKRPIPQIRIATTYPLGLFRTWTLIRFPRRILVAPAPVPRGMYPLAFDNHEISGEQLAYNAGDEEFSGLRPYRYDDPIRRIAWRASARSDSLVSKHFQDGMQDRTVWLRWHDAPVRDSETRLSVLCRWVIDAEEQGLLYGLSIPGKELPPGQGPAHREQCLKALALFVESE